MDYQRALLMAPMNATARINLALLLQAEGHYKLAWHQLSTVIQHGRTNPQAREARAIINLQMGHTDAALQDINVAIATRPSPMLYTERGVIHQFTGDLMGAVADYRKALMVDPSYHLAHYNLGNVLFNQHLIHQVQYSMLL